MSRIVNRIMNRIMTIAILIVFVITLSSCQKNNEVHVDFVTYAETVMESVTLEEGSYLKFEYTPANAGYVFGGWYTDETFETKFDSETELTEDIILYAKWDIPSDDVVLEELPYYEYMKSDNPVITITVKDIGSMTLELFPDVAPMTVDNFIYYVQNNSYTNNQFHRVIESFMIQGGAMNNTACAIEGEFQANGIENNLSHFRGVLSTARTSVMNSATSQFFIMHVDYFYLNGSYAAFGGLTSGFDVLDIIANTDTNFSDAPLTPVIISSITIELNGYVPNSPVCAN